MMSLCTVKKIVPDKLVFNYTSAFCQIWLTYHVENIKSWTSEIKYQNVKSIYKLYVKISSFF